MWRGAGLLVAVVACASGDARAPTSRTAAPSLTLAPADEPGQRLTLTVTIADRRGAPLVAEVHVYQADAGGAYTPDRPMDEPHARLAGRVTTDGAGRFTLHTIRPGHYPQAVTLDGVARHIPAHVHMDVQSGDRPERRVQVVFTDDPELAEPYWQAWARELRQPVVPLHADGAAVAGAVTIALD